MMKTLLIITAALALVAIGALLVFVYVIQNVEQPDYVLIEQDGDFELRDYPALTVAEVRRDGDRKGALSAGFGPLARYIFARGPEGTRDSGKIAMTAPVIQQPSSAPPADGTADWTIGFIMPRAAVAAGLPDPANADVRLTERSPRRVAAVRFSGHTTDARSAEQRQRLEDWIGARGLRIASAPIYAYYNDPMTPGPLRRNEVLYDVVSE
jgi:DNA gyrase inhibitor GyrI